MVAINAIFYIIEYIQSAARRFIILSLWVS